MDLAFRFLAGGTIVSIFAALGDVLNPKSFAGLFGAAPSVALATISLTILANGKQYAAVEARSMIAGAVAFFIYTFISCRLIMRLRIAGAYAASGAIVIWFAVAFGIYAEILK
jgi:hypothetical protein